MDYAQSHSVVMASVADLHIVRFDQAWAKDGHVLLRYTAEGSHCGEPYKGLQKTGRHAVWAAAAIFEVEAGKIRSFTKDWDQKTMQVSGHLLGLVWFGLVWFGVIGWHGMAAFARCRCL